MKKNTLVATALLFILSSAYHAHGQVVTLGDATFDASSDQVPASSYFAVTPEVVNVFTGYGDKVGFTRTDVYHRLESVAGVKALQWRTTVVTPPPAPDPVAGLLKTTPAAATEDWWLARDTQGNLRVLKVVRVGLVSFEASANGTPPIVLPASVTVGQSWDLFGSTMTVVGVNVASGGYSNVLKVKIETLGAAPQFNYYSAGAGLVITEASSAPAPSGSGWKLKQP